jgi:hypothetical protein
MLLKSQTHTGTQLQGAGFDDWPGDDDDEDDNDDEDGDRFGGGVAGGYATLTVDAGAGAGGAIGSSSKDNSSGEMGDFQVCACVRVVHYCSMFANYFDNCVYVR